jgi:replicative DNA helicase
MEELYKKGINRLSSAPIHIDDTAALNIFELRAKCRRL